MDLIRPPEDKVGVSAANTGIDAVHGPHEASTRFLRQEAKMWRLIVETQRGGVARSKAMKDKCAGELVTEDAVFDDKDECLNFDNGKTAVVGEKKGLGFIDAVVSIFAHAGTHVGQTCCDADNGQQKRPLDLAGLILLHKRSAMQEGEHGHVVNVAEEEVESAVDDGVEAFIYGKAGIEQLATMALGMKVSPYRDI